MKNGKQLYIKAEYFHGQETANSMNILAEGNYFNGSVLAANKGEVILKMDYQAINMPLKTRQTPGSESLL
ncbi:hypothetical protein [Cytobacillus firmus]|uniref:hypothetical protein n=1 Tax=Cytobacillus firmus TaxID=1399 RepID=UPI0024945077|nr:hypothetical protein [Cytobacillus firmus]